MPKMAALIPVALGGTAASTMPLMLASMAATGIGSLMNNREQSKALDSRNSRNEAVDAAEKQRQDLLRDQSQSALQKLIEQSTVKNKAAQIADEGARLGAAVSPGAQLPIAPIDAIAGPGRRDSKIVNTDAAGRLAEATQETRKRLAAMAGLQAFDTASARTGDAFSAAAADEATRGGLKAGGLRSAADQRSYYDAEYQNFKPSGLGSLLTAAGQIGSTAAGSGVGGGGAGPDLNLIWT